MKFYSYYKDGFYSGIWDNKIKSLNEEGSEVRQSRFKIPTIAFKCYDFDNNFSVVSGVLQYKGCYLDGVVEWEISKGSDNPQVVFMTLEFPADVPRDFCEGYVGSGCVYDK